jgi:hypothetical protein
MQAIMTIGLDIAKSIFQVHGIDAEGHVIIRRQLKRRYVLAFFQKFPLCLARPIWAELCQKAGYQECHISSVAAQKNRRATVAHSTNAPMPHGLASESARLRFSASQIAPKVHWLR